MDWSTWKVAVCVSVTFVAGYIVGSVSREQPRIEVRSAAPVTSSDAPERVWAGLKRDRDVLISKCVGKHGVAVPGYDSTDDTGNVLAWGVTCVDENSVLPIGGRRR